MTKIYVLGKNKKTIISYFNFFIFTAVKNRCILHKHVLVMNYNHANTPMYFNFICYKNLLSSIKVYRGMPY